MFGDFAAADDFHDDGHRSAHQPLTSVLQNHQQSLNDVGAKAHRAGYSFSAMDDNNAKVLREV